MAENWVVLAAGGLFSGLLAGLLGIGGGTVLVPLLMLLGYNYDKAVATSSLAIVITSLSGSFQNWRMGYLKLNKVLLLGLPGILTAFLGAFLVGKTPKYLLEAAFGGLMLLNIYLTSLKKQLATESLQNQQKSGNPSLIRLLTGSIAGFLAGVFGVGGGVIMVPFQMLFLREPIKTAIQTSLGVIVMTALAACVGHARQGNVLFLGGIILGLGGLVGVQISTRYLPKLPEGFVRISFNILLALVAVYAFSKAWLSFYNG